jgi:hypothetical protein
MDSDAFCIQCSWRAPADLRDAGAGEGSLKAPRASEQDPAAEVSASLPPCAVRQSFEDASDDARFAMAVAAFAEVLKESPFVSSDLLDTIGHTGEARVIRTWSRASRSERACFHIDTLISFRCRARGGLGCSPSFSGRV